MLVRRSDELTHQIRKRLTIFGYMFESILIRPNSSRNYPLDCGQMIESLFFYNRIMVHIGRNEIKTLFDLAEPDVLENLLSLPQLNFFFNNSHSGIVRYHDKEICSFDTFGLASLDLEKELYHESFSHRKDKSRSKKFAKKISRLIKVHELPSNFNSTLIEQLKDEDFRKKVLIASINNYYPDHNWELTESKYELEFLNPTNFKIHTNLDFESTNKISIDSPILALLNACEDLYVMSESSSEISVPEFNSEIIRLKLNSTLETINRPQKEIEVFNHFDFEQSWALREAINAKRIHVKAVLNLFEKAEKYRWIIKDLPPNTELFLEYIDRIRKGSSLETYQAKAIRFYLFNGAGFILGALKPEIGIPVTLGLNAFNDFLLDKLLQKWIPNQFIEGELRPLIARPK